ncbi:hypothetical protein COO60DRAFT_1126908 [Scenedesmus sp. NREL 46B-D3]|nr:hypothetical protein COO60DRAFT_1126908 [Scenedesmus sp. NREL 46B-D3]
MFCVWGRGAQAGLVQSVQSVVWCFICSCLYPVAAGGAAVLDCCVTQAVHLLLPPGSAQPPVTRTLLCVLLLAACQSCRWTPGVAAPGTCGICYATRCMSLLTCWEIIWWNAPTYPANRCCTALSCGRLDIPGSWCISAAVAGNAVRSIVGGRRA